MTDGIRTLARDDRGIDVDVTESFPTFDPVDDGFTRTGNPMEVPETEGDMETTKPSALATAVFNLCAPGGQTPAAMDAVVRAVAKPCPWYEDGQHHGCHTEPTPVEREQAIRLAREAKALAEARWAEAERVALEADLALRELTGDDSTHTRWLRAHLAGDKAAALAARVTQAAENFLQYGHHPANDLPVDRVTAEVDRIRTEQSKR